MKYLTDQTFLQSLEEPVPIMMTRPEATDDDAQSDLDPSQDLFSPELDVSPGIHRQYLASSSRVTDELKDELTLLLKDVPLCQEEYKIYKTYSDAPESYRFLIDLLSAHLFMTAEDLHEMLKLTEKVIFSHPGDAGEANLPSSKLSWFKKVYFVNS